MTITRTSPTAKKIYLTRHAQAEHNVTSDWTIRDAPLTDFGRKQCREMHAVTKGTLQQGGQLLVCSPLRRTMETMIVGFPHLQSRLEGSGKPPILLDILQEVGNVPCDTPLDPIEALRASNNGLFADLDFSTLSPDYSSKMGIFSPGQATERAKRVRKWLRDRPEEEIVVVAHGDILRFILDRHHSSREWANTEIKLCTFATSSDEDAVLIELQGDIRPPDADTEPTTSELA
ncbi:hypothetical protein JCM24511_04088 [Saitozyma sp. JCM 24511]|nr:hypothetical protein JCM24511_04088 [Saitozyma sp. JCM 24511]